MKYLFVIFYTIISTQPRPCPNSYQGFGCNVYHGTFQDTTELEVITTDELRLKRIVKEYPEARIDTFLLTPVLTTPLNTFKY